MAGNVRADDIVAQQGDLLFLKTDQQKHDDLHEVDGYDSHMFSKGKVLFSEPTGKKSDKYAIGYIEVPENNLLSHPEHVEVPLPKGNYLVRICRSWEANPVAIWTVNID